ncbi:MAG: FliA/WhiG family RNA polymerase sigma factor [Nitrospirae bacterium]|nr:FliA/WhiG family RNA polymerase sigma factor [Nitrospirota bacterium]MCL5062560.1 FliA/WhiG family RNA polymerase sigma factor [Nitrospirota bacterium]MDA8214096.1 FliA/WhiG family RNA polymerase sigma factor [Nitrospiraceae bacterium]MDA8339131.1 FliA/WhiG family RNA polymerase sigma factor [Nitrospiraceae bacterium]
MKRVTGKQKERIVEQFLPRVKYYAGKYAFCLPPELSIEDLVSAGIVGLLEAIERYDPSMNATLSTFADFRIRGAIIDEIRSMQWASKDARKKLEEVRNTYSELEKSLNRIATDEEVAERLNITLDELYKTLSTANTMNMVNLEDLGVSKDGESLDILECISREDERDMLDELNLKELRSALGNAIDGLPEKERLVVTLYYFEELTMKEIGKILDISESRVCQLHGKVIIKLRNKMEQFRDGSA